MENGQCAGDAPTFISFCIQMIKGWIKFMYAIENLNDPFYAI
jgi:hypothetical protein